MWTNYGQKYEKPMKWEILRGQSVDKYPFDRIIEDILLSMNDF